MSRKVGVCLSGCGVRDGSEIHETVLTLLALDHAGVEAVCIAPDGAQTQVVNHVDGKQQKEKRDILAESGRIARGNIKNIKKVTADDLDALIFPGGFGAALNLCDFGINGEKCTVHPEVNRLVREMHKAEKPIGAMCIAPALIARILGDHGVLLTVGTDASTAKKIEAMGAHHQFCAVQDIVVDEKNKIVSTPAYMLANCISDVSTGIQKLVKKIVELIG